MKIGIGLPNPVPGTPGSAILEFARRAEQRGFHGVATIDRVAYPNHDTLATLAAAAAVTSRIQLLSNILLAPLYPPPLLAKSAASIDQFSGGRFTLGVAVGGRALRSPAAIRDAVAAFTDVGCTELYLDATTSSPDQVDRLADVML